MQIKTTPAQKQIVQCQHPHFNAPVITIVHQHITLTRAFNLQGLPNQGYHLI